MMAVMRWLWRRKWYCLIILLALAGLTALTVKLWQARATAAAYQEQLANYDFVTQIHEGAYLQQTAQLELYETLIREYSPQPGTELAYQAQVKVVYKTRTIKVPVVETKIVYRDENIDISGDISDDKDGDRCADGTCTLDLSYTLAPLQFDLFVTRVKGKYATIIDTHRADVSVEMTTRLDPAVFQDDRPWFAGVGPLVRLHAQKQDYSWYDLGLAVEVGYLFSKWYVKGQVLYLDGFGAGVVFGGRW